MKKAIFVVSLLLLMVFSGIGMAFAQTEHLNDCCKLQNNVKIGDADADKFIKGDVVEPLATEIPTCNLTADASPAAIRNTANWGMVCALNTVYTVTNWVFYIMTMVAVLMIIFGGFTYITAAGDPTKAGKGKSILMYAIIGLAIALIAKIIPSLVRFAIGM